MPLYDHCRPPLDELYSWKTIHSGMLAEIARNLNRKLRTQFTAIESKVFGNEIEIDIATFDIDSLSGTTSNGTATAVLPKK